MINVIGKRKIWYTISGILFAASIILVLSWGLNFGIDFTGGTLYELKWESTPPSTVQIQEIVHKTENVEAIVQASGEQGTLIRLPNISEESHQKIGKALQALGKFEELRFETVGPTVGKELKTRSLTALGIVMLAIIL